MITLKLTRDQAIIIDMCLNGWSPHDERPEDVGRLLDAAVSAAGQEALPEPWEYED